MCNKGYSSHFYVILSVCVTDISELTPFPRRKHRAGASSKAAKDLALPVAEHQELVKIIITGNGHSRIILGGPCCREFNGSSCSQK